MQDVDSRPSSSEVAPPEIPKRPSATLLESFRRERDYDAIAEAQKKINREMPMESSPEMDETVGDNMADVVSDDEDFEPLYQEVDDNHQSKYEPKRRAGPPQVRIERKIFPNPQLTSSMTSSTNGSEEMLDRQLSSPMLYPRSINATNQHIENLYALPHKTTQSSQTRTQSPPIMGTSTHSSQRPYEYSSNTRSPTSTSASQSKHPNVPHLSPLHTHPRFITTAQSSVNTHQAPHTAVAKVTPLFSQSPPQSPPPGAQAYPSRAHAYPPTSLYTQPNTDSAYALATMPRRKKNNKFQIEEYQRPSVRIYTGTKDDTATIPHEQVKAEVARPPILQGLGRVKPPTPPMRRLPSWVRFISMHR